MKTFGQQVLILGGFYFIISFLSSLSLGSVLFNIISFVIFIIMLIVLCIKRKYNFLLCFQNKFTKSSNYLLGLGIVQYFEIIFITLPGIVYGYKATEAEYNGTELPAVPLEYVPIISYIYWIILGFVLILATYWNLKKSRTQKSSD